MPVSTRAHEELDRRGEACRGAGDEQADQPDAQQSHPTVAVAEGAGVQHGHRESEARAERDEVECRLGGVEGAGDVGQGDAGAAGGQIADRCGHQQRGQDHACARGNVRARHPPSFRRPRRP
jgi:hypothetical protein